VEVEVHLDIGRDPVVEAQLRPVRDAEGGRDRVHGQGAALDVIAEQGAGAPRVVDLCCGVGNLACAIATHVPGARVWASDLTESCVAQAQGNVDRLGLGGRVSVHRGDLLGAFDGLALAGTIDVVVANPPYISSGRLTDGDRQVLVAHEPREAFDGGPYGLTIHQRMIKEAPQVLHGRGVLLFEFGLGQERQVELLFRRARAYQGVRFVADDDGNPRVAIAALAGAAGPGSTAGADAPAGEGRVAG
jgi:release factor glutamine methyltransferase